jgi:hypothetical protein
MKTLTYLLVLSVITGFTETDPVKASIRIDKHVIAVQILPDLTESDLNKVKEKIYDEAAIELKVEEAKVWPLTKKLRWVSFTVETLDGHKGHYEGPVSTKKRKVGFYFAQDGHYEKKLKGKFGVGTLPNGIFK